MPAATDQISYQDLYTRWEKSNWRAMEYDFTQDREDWHEKFSDLQRKAALWNYALFFHGEDSVTDNLSPFIDAAPREEQKYFLATQQVDEARHAVLFKRFMHEVVGAGDGTIASGLEATRGELTYGFIKTFEHLDRVTDELRRDRSRTKLAQAVAMYHVIVEATLAQPGQHFIEAYLTEQDVLPAFRAGMRNVALDEQRHIGFGVKLLRDLAAEDPEVPEAVADLLRDVLPHTVGVFAPPNWDRRYSECFGFTLEEIYEEGARSFESKMRAAGLPVEDLPGPLLYPIDLPPRERALRGMALLQAGILGEKNGPPARDADTMALLFDTVRRGVDFRTAPAGPLTVQWDFPDADPWHLRLDNGSTAVTPGASRRRTSSSALATRTSSTWSAGAWTRAARWRPAGCARAARCGRCGRRAVSSWPRARRSRPAAVSVKPSSPSLRADLGDVHARVLEDGQRAEAAEQALGGDHERAVAGGEAGAGGEDPGGHLEHELARRVVDRTQPELARERGGEVGVAERRLAAQAVVILVQRDAAEPQRADVDEVDAGVDLARAGCGAGAWRACRCRPRASAISTSTRSARLNRSLTAGRASTDTRRTSPLTERSSLMRRSASAAARVGCRRARRRTVRKGRGPRAASPVRLEAAAEPGSRHEQRPRGRRRGKPARVRAGQLPGHREATAPRSCRRRRDPRREVSTRQSRRRPRGLTRSPLECVGHRPRVAAPPRGEAAEGRPETRRQHPPRDGEAPRVEGCVVVPHEALGAGRRDHRRRRRLAEVGGRERPCSSEWLPCLDRERPCSQRRRPWPGRGWSRRKAVPRGSPSLRRAAVRAEPCNPTAIACPIASTTAVAASPPVSRRTLRR